MGPDDSAISKIKSKDTKSGSPELSTAWLQAPKLRIHKLGEGDQPKGTPCSGAAGERSGWAQFG